MALIVAIDDTRGDGPADRTDIPVLSVTPAVDDGYVTEYITYYVKYGDGEVVKQEHQSADSLNDFRIGLCRFVKEAETWYWLPDQSDQKHKIVYGADALEAYASGEMFKRLYNLFPAD